MTKDEIKKTLEFCGDLYHSCDDCPYDDVRNCTDALKIDARELIIEQEREIAQLKEKVEELRNEKWDAQDDLDCYYDEYKRLQDDYSKLQEQFAQYQMASNKEIRANKEDSEQRTANNIADWLDYRVNCGYGSKVSDIVRSLAEQIRHNYCKKTKLK